MKFFALLAALFILTTTVAEAQRRPGPRPVPRPMPVPPRYPPPRPRPVPVPPPGPQYHCAGPDLYQRNWLIHRFRWVNDCHVAVQDLRYRRRFCDEGVLYNYRGDFLRDFRNQYECRRHL